jgi:glycine betaine/proline transport system substrate-binding protein
MKRNTAENWLEKGASLYNSGIYEEAIKCIDKAININPEDSRSWGLKGTILYGLKKYEEAIKWCDKALKLNPRDNNALKSKGASFYGLKRYEEAMKWCEKSLELDPNQYDALHMKGGILGKLKRYDEAIKCHDKALKLNPKNTNALNSKGVALYGLKRYDEAIKFYDEAIDIDPENSQAYSNKGQALCKLKRYDESIKQCDRAIEFDPKDDNGWIYKGNTLCKLTRYDEAIKCFDKAIEIDSECEDAKNKRKIAVEKLREQQPTIAHRTTKLDSIEIEELTKSPIEILRDYSVLSNNDIKFGIRLINNTDFVIIDADTILDYTKNLFSMKDSEIQHLGNITPNGKRTATYLLKPLGCIHNEQINAIITYKDHTGKKQTIHMRPKEVHCVCPFLKEKPMGEGEYSRLAAGSEFVQEGISFKGISVDDLTTFMGETCRHTLHKVREYDIEGKKVIYLSGESVGEKAYYLLTAVIQDYKGLTQIVLRAHSDKKYGLNGFMNEIADSLRHLVGSVQNAKEIGIIENTQVINIIDSVVQRTNFNMGDGGNAKVNIKDSVVQRSKIGKEE